MIIEGVGWGREQIKKRGKKTWKMHIVNVQRISYIASSVVMYGDKNILLPQYFV